MARTMVAVLVLVAVLVVVALVAATRPGARFGPEYAQRLAEALAARPAAAGAVLTAADAAGLPEPVQRWLARSGAIGRPPVRSVHAFFDAEMFAAPGEPGMRGPAEQVDVVAPTRRLFFMTTRMAGLPVAVLHDHGPAQTSMRVRLAALADVVDLRGAALARTETVTVLNDLCFFAPSALVGPAFAWTPRDATHAEVRYTAGAHTVGATLVFDAAGDLVDFVSEDRGELQRDGSLLQRRWSTPMGDWRDVDGRRVPTSGQAIWHRPDGPFVYGRFALRTIRFE